MDLNKKSEILFQEITSIEIEEYDNLKALGLTLGIILATPIIIAAATLDISVGLGNGSI